MIPRLQDTPKQPRVLVVDDEPSICWGFHRLLTDEGCCVLTASSAEEGLRLAREHPLDLVLLDVRLPGEDGLSALPRFREVTHQAPVIVMTAFGDLETAVKAVRQGATDYLTKPFKLDDVAKTCRETIRLSQLQLMDEVRTHDRETLPQSLVGRSAVMQRIFKQIAIIAESDVSVLITGEIGTGKELVATAIHANSRRSKRPFLAMNSVELSDSLVESELFGHVQGGYTGAIRDSASVFALAEGGTIFLDEIGDLPLLLQAKLLRVLEQRKYSRVGDAHPVSCNVRFITATHCDLPLAVQERKFREDLFYRLSLVEIHLPPLRERVEDIPLLCTYFLRELGYSKPEKMIATELMSALQARPWWGNVRELRNSLQSASVHARGRQICISDLPAPQPIRSDELASIIVPTSEVIERWLEAKLSNTCVDSENQTDLLDKFSCEMEPPLLRAVLKRTAGNRAVAANILGLHRGTLRARLKRYGIDPAE